MMNAVTEVKWVPGSESLFVAGLSDGTLLVFDRELQEQPLRVVRDKVHTFKVIKCETKANPIASWVVSNSSVKGFEFSPDCRHLAVVSKDGQLRVFDFTAETLLVTFKSYFGGLTCVCWSPDGKYILVSGHSFFFSSSLVSHTKIFLLSCFLGFLWFISVFLLKRADWRRG